MTNESSTNITTLWSMTMSANATNGRPRKQLSDQLDRLDGLIDALAEGLSQAVTDACREGTRQAVRDVLLELGNNHELRAMFASPAPAPAPAPNAQAPPAAKRPGVWNGLREKLAAVRAAVAGAATRAKEAVIRRFVVAGEAAVALGHLTGETLPARKMLLVGLGVGVAVSAACTSAAVQTGRWLTRAARRVGLLG